MTTVTCRDCGVEFAKPRGPWDAGRRCRLCFGARRRRMARLQPARLAKKTGRPRGGIRKLRDCPCCGIQYWPWKNGAHFINTCSPSCGRRLRTKNRVATIQKCVVFPRKCRRCLTAFVTRWANQACCSTICQKRALNRHKRLRRRGVRGGEAISLSEIYQRDKGQCALCGREVDASLLVPDRMAPTLDHIVPLSKGGKHVRANVQLAHHHCNSGKGNRVAVAA